MDEEAEDAGEMAAALATSPGIFATRACARHPGGGAVECSLGFDDDFSDNGNGVSSCSLEASLRHCTTSLGGTVLVVGGGSGGGGGESFLVSEKNGYVVSAPRGSGQEGSGVGGEWPVCSGAGGFGYNFRFAVAVSEAQPAAAAAAVRASLIHGGGGDGASVDESGGSGLGMGVVEDALRNATVACDHGHSDRVLPLRCTMPCVCAAAKERIYSILAHRHLGEWSSSSAATLIADDGNAGDAAEGSPAGGSAAAASEGALYFLYARCGGPCGAVSAEETTAREARYQRLLSHDQRGAASVPTAGRSGDRGRGTDSLTEDGGAGRGRKITGNSGSANDSEGAGSSHPDFTLPSSHHCWRAADDDFLDPLSSAADLFEVSCAGKGADPWPLEGGALLTHRPLGEIIASLVAASVIACFLAVAAAKAASRHAPFRSPPLREKLPVVELLERGAAATMSTEGAPLLGNVVGHSAGSKLASYAAVSTSVHMPQIQAAAHMRA